MEREANQIANALTTILDLLEVVRRTGEGAAETVEVMRQALHGQLPLPGIGETAAEPMQPCESCALEQVRLQNELAAARAEIAALEADNKRLSKGLFDIVQESRPLAGAVDVPCPLCGEGAETLAELTAYNDRLVAERDGLRARVGELEGGIRSALSMTRYLPTAVERDSGVRQMILILTAFVAETVGATHESPVPGWVPGPGVDDGK